MKRNGSNKTLFFVLTLIIALAFAGCTKKPTPTPVDTLANGGYGSNTEYISDIGYTGQTYTGTEVEGSAIDGEFGPGGEGLETRPYGDGAEGIEGILPSIYFDYDQAFVRPSEREKLQQASEYLASNPGSRIIAEGHCDWRGTTEYNLALGDRRANAVKQYLLTLGADAGRVDIVSKGDLEAVTEASASQMDQDRRVDLLVVQ